MDRNKKISFMLLLLLLCGRVGSLTSWASVAGAERMELREIHKYERFVQFYGKFVLGDLEESELQALYEEWKRLQKRKEEASEIQRIF